MILDVLRHARSEPAELTALTLLFGIEIPAGWYCQVDLMFIELLGYRCSVQL